MRISARENHSCSICKRPALYECDTTTNNDILGFVTCGVKMCKSHIGSNPQADYHRCLTCSRIRGDEGFFVGEKPWETEPLEKKEEKEPF